MVISVHLIHTYRHVTIDRSPVSITAHLKFTLAHIYIYIYSFSWRFYPKRLTIAIYVRCCTPLEQL